VWLSEFALGLLYCEKVGELALEPIKIWELVDKAVSHKWSPSESQRGLEWKAAPVRDLAQSTFRIGSLLFWNSESRQEECVAVDGATPSLWIVDGQQRTTAFKVRGLCDGMDAMEVGCASNGVISIAVSLPVALRQRHLQQVMRFGNVN
jgi:hypothetical protein